MQQRKLSKPDVLAQRAMSFAQKEVVLLGSLFVFIASLLLLNQRADLDLFARLAVGRLFEQLGHMPLVDPFSFTPKKAFWVDHEWLAGVSFFNVYTWAGPFGLMLLKIIFVFLTSLLLLKARRAYAGRAPSELFQLVFFNLSLYGLWGDAIRSLVFTYFGVALILALALDEGGALGRWRAALIPIYMLVWANAHAGFVVGLGLLGFCCLHAWMQQRRWKDLALALVLSLGATLFNPYGAVIFWHFVLSAVFMSRPAIPEWGSVRLFSYEALWVALWLIFLGTGFWRQRAKLDWLALLAIFAALVLGLRSYRMIAFFYLLAFVLGARYWDAFWDALKAASQKRWETLAGAASLGWILFSACALINTALFLARGREFNFDLSNYPVAALDWLKRERAEGKLLTHFDLGSFALWKLYPKFQVALDGRYEEVYPESTVDLAVRALTPSEAQHVAALKQLAPDFVLIDAAWSAALVEREFPGFRVAYRDQQFALLERSL